MSNVSKFTSREGESLGQKIHRSGRFFRTNDNWFFKTREGVDYGPFHSQTECRYAYQEFLEVVANKSELSALPDDFQDNGSDWQMPKINFN